MAKKTLIFFPDPILRKRAKRVDLFDARKLRQIRQDLEDSLKSQRHGIGIAAPQIGLSIKIVLIDVSSRVKGTKPLFLINPLIKDAREEGLSREGCMSLPDGNDHAAGLRLQEIIRRSQRCELIAHGFH